jgi:twitching motility protein PilT
MFENENSIIEQREVWTDTLSYGNWLKYSLRQASDVIMLWEMRDLETFRLALRAAETWNLVFATLHTSGASRTIARIIDMFPSEEKSQIKAQLSNSLIWIIWQDLIKQSDNKWRILAYELLVNNTSIANMIRKEMTHQINWVIETSMKEWMVPMKKSLEYLYHKWLISRETLKNNLISNEL